MRIKYIYLPVLILTSFYIGSCQFGIEDDSLDPSNLTVVEGQVVDGITGDWIGGASVKIVYDSLELATTTNSIGFFSEQLALSSNNEITIFVSKSGYELDTIRVIVSAGITNKLSLIKLYSDQSIVSDSSGSAASIYLFS